MLLIQKFKIELPNFSNLSPKFKLVDNLYQSYTLVNLIIKVTSKNENLKYSVWYSHIYPISFVLSLRKESKHIENICFHNWKETTNKDTPIESTNSIVHDEHHENGFTIISGNSFR